MDRIAAIAGTEVVAAHAPNAAAPQLALSHGWRRHDGVFSSFWVISPQGQSWKVSTKALVSSTLLIRAEDLVAQQSAPQALVASRMGTAGRRIYDEQQPGVELARIVTEGPAKAGVYAAVPVASAAEVPEWLIATALACARVDYGRQIRRA